GRERGGHRTLFSHETRQNANEKRRPPLTGALAPAGQESASPHRWWVASALARAIVTFRRNPCALVRRIALPRSAAASSSSVADANVVRSTRSHARRGCHAGSSEPGAIEFHGHTS